MDLLTASHDALVALIHQQQAVISELTATVARLEARIRELEGGTHTTQRMPGHKPGPAPPPAAPRPRRPRALHFARRRSIPTQQVMHAVEQCPTCLVALAGGSPKRTREVIDLPLTPIVVTEHVFVERCCAGCGRRYTPAVELAGVVVGQSRLGSGLVALIATLREEARLPYRAIQRLLSSLYGLELSVGGLRGAIGQVVQAGQGALGAIQTAIGASPAVHVDETGWREAGHNGYVWTASTADACRFIHGGRGKQMLGRVLGEDPQGVLVSDFYAVYDGYAGLQQKCWAHLLRDIHDLRVQAGGDPAVTAWAEAVGANYAAAQTVVRDLAHLPAEAVPRQVARRRLMADLLEVCQPYLADERAPPALLCRRIAKQLDALFVFVLDPAVPATNNAAERSLRHLVVSRKISGGTRSRAGTEDKLALASLFTTWRLRGLNPYHACRDLLISPQL
jgi:transposase